VKQARGRVALRQSFAVDWRRSFRCLAPETWDEGGRERCSTLYATGLKSLYGALCSAHTGGMFFLSSSVSRRLATDLRTN